jgi:hypothetical protein
MAKLKYKTSVFDNLLTNITTRTCLGPEMQRKETKIIADICS